MVVRIMFFLLFLTMTIVLPACAEEDAVTELKIEVLESVAAEDCLVKSANGDSLSMHYTGTIHKDGSEFDSSVKRGKPFTFPLGGGRVIKGWEQGLLDMCVGEKRKLTIPPELGYGARGRPPKIPANSVLVFDVELLKIDRKNEL
jgi:FK506-binding protein 2